MSMSVVTDNSPAGSAVWSDALYQWRKLLSVARIAPYPPPVKPEELDCSLILLSHSHDDHTDPDTLAAYRAALEERTRARA